MRDFASCLTLSVILAGFAIVSLNWPTHLAFRVSWVFTVFVLLLVVLLLSGSVRLPGARKEIAAVEREQLRSEDAES